MSKLTMILIPFLIIGFIFANRSGNYKSEEITIPVEVIEVYAYEPLEKVKEPIIEEKLPSNAEIDIISLTLAGECYDDKPADKRRVAEVIVNRVSDGRFGESVVEVVTAKGQFYGYSNQSRPVSDSDIQVAEETLHDWYANDCKALSEYLFFCAGSNRENVFRVKY